MKKISFLLLLAALLTGCEQEGQAEEASTELQAYECARDETKALARSQSSATPIVASYEDSQIDFLPSNGRWRVMGELITDDVGIFICTTDTIEDRDDLDCGDTICVLN